METKKLSLRDRLGKLFTSSVVYRPKGKGKTVIIDPSKFMSSGASTSTKSSDRYGRVYSTLQAFAGQGHGSMFNTSDYGTMIQQRVTMFSDYETMDTNSLIASALDIYSDECCTTNERGEVVSISSTDSEIKELLENLFYDILDVDFNLWPWIRNTCKYGDTYLGLNVQEGLGVIGVVPLSSYFMTRIEGSEDNPYDVKFKILNPEISNNTYSGKTVYSKLREESIDTFESFEVAHFRLLSDTNFLPYGKSMLEGIRKDFKILMLLEDAMLLHRIMRSPEKRLFKIDIGNLPENEIDTYMQKIMDGMKKIPHVNEETGQYNLRYNLQNMLEDFYIPVRGDNSGMSIESLPGLEYAPVEDLEFIRSKIFAGLKIPKAFLGYDENVSGKCVSPETQIPLLDGRTLTVRQLIDEYNSGVKNYVYSLDEETKNIVPGEIEWAGFTRMNTEVVRVHLDNNKYIDCTPDHNFLTRDGLWVEAKNLKENQPLMPLYTQLSTNKIIKDYTEVYHPSTGKYEMVHRLVAKHYNIKKQNGNVIHHIDFNKHNNNPENLDGTMNWFKHKQFHIEQAKLGNHSKAMREYWGSERQKLNSSKGGKNNNGQGTKNLLEWHKNNKPWNYGKSIYDIKLCPGCKKEIRQSRPFCSKKCYKNNQIGNTYNVKYTKIDKDLIYSIAEQSKSFRDIESKLNIDRNTLNKLFNFHKIDKIDLISNMPLSIENKGFINNYRKQLSEYKNHTVVRVEFLTEKIDTCDLTIKEYHNFGTSAGVIIHNSTLAQEDVRFARTIDRIQKMIISELNKIALVHLYSMGIEDQRLTDFKITLTNPSIVYEQEKLELFRQKVDLAASMKDLKMISRDYMYKNIFNFSDSEASYQAEQSIEDIKLSFREAQIENEGNDPKLTKESVGTPWDIANLYVSSKGETDNDIEIEDVMPKDKGGSEKGGQPGAGRPKAKTNTGTDRSGFGRDPLGKRNLIKKTFDYDDKINYKYKGGNPFAFENVNKKIKKEQNNTTLEYFLNIED